MTTVDLPEPLCKNNRRASSEFKSIYGKISNKFTPKSFNSNEPRVEDTIQFERIQIKNP